MVGQVRVADPFVFHAAHGHFHFPLASFGLYSVAAGGGPGAPVALSPKNGFCIADSYIYDTTVPHAGTFVGSQGSCADPTTLRGMTVGAVDEYDYRLEFARRFAQCETLNFRDVADPVWYLKK